MRKHAAAGPGWSRARSRRGANAPSIPTPRTPRRLPVLLCLSHCVLLGWSTGSVHACSPSDVRERLPQLGLEQRRRSGRGRRRRAFSNLVLEDLVQRLLDGSRAIFSMRVSRLVAVRAGVQDLRDAVLERERLALRRAVVVSVFCQPSSMTCRTSASTCSTGEEATRSWTPPRSSPSGRHGACRPGGSPSPDPRDRSARRATAACSPQRGRSHPPTTWWGRRFPSSS